MKQLSLTWLRRKKICLRLRLVLAVVVKRMLKTAHLALLDSAFLAYVCLDSEHDPCLKPPCSLSRRHFHYKFLRRSQVSLAERINTQPQDRLAIVSGAIAINYKNLAIMTNKLTGYLNNMNASTIGVFMPRGIHAVIALSSVLSSKHTLWMLDLNWPEKYVEQLFLLHKPSAILITRKDSLRFKCFANITIIEIEEILEGSDNSGASSDLTYNATLISTTSGSTGFPKLVATSFAAISNAITNAISIFEVNAASNLANLSSFAFDASIFEILLCIMSGGTLHIPPGNKPLLGKSLGTFLKKSKINLTVLTPSVLSTVPVQTFPEMQSLILVGEKPSLKLVKRWFYSGFNIYNAYGTAETAIMVLAHKMNDAREYSVIGQPISNVELRVCDHKNNISNQIGALHVKVDFPIKIISEYTENITSYLLYQKEQPVFFNTQDIVKKDPDLGLIYLFRNNEMVKIKGVLINPEEIIYAINSTYLIEQSAILYVTSANSYHKRMVCFYSSVDGIPVASSRIKSIMLALLPREKIPSRFYHIKTWPINHSGKTDIKQLRRFLESKTTYKQLEVIET